MAQYIQLKTDDDETILIEIDEAKVLREGGLAKAGLKDITQDVVEAAQQTFETAIEVVLRKHMQIVRNVLQACPEMMEKVELTFGLKATGEAGILAIAKGSGETNYSIKLVWSPSNTSGPAGGVSPDNIEE
jgi:hypothetical protein